MQYRYQFVKINAKSVLGLQGADRPLDDLGAQGFRVIDTQVQNDPQGDTIFIYLMEKELP